MTPMIKRIPIDWKEPSNRFGFFERVDVVEEKGSVSSLSLVVECRAFHHSHTLENHSLTIPKDVDDLLLEDPGLS
jgi:hypothetical protein